MKMTILAACEACAKMGRITNGCDVEITESIMSRLALIVLICVAGYIVVKLIDVFSNTRAEKRKRKWDEMDKDRKRKAELLDKKLEIMKELCYMEGTKKEVNDGVETEKYVKVLKPYSDDENNEINKYCTVLDTAQSRMDA